MDEVPRTGPTYRRYVLAVLPLLPLFLIWFLFTTAHAGLGVLINVDGIFLLALLGASLVCEVLFFRHLRRETDACKYGVLWIFAFGAHFLAGCFVLLMLMFNPVPVEVHRRVVPGQGPVAILYSSVMQAQEATLARVLFDIPLFHVYLPREVAPTDSPHIGIDMVRPEGHGQGNDWQIHVAPNRCIAAFYDGTLCILAWDPETGRTWGGEGLPIDRLSPFLLMGEEGGLQIDDVDRLVRNAADERRKRKEYAEENTFTSRPDPDADASLRTALSHPNPAVRAAARRIVDAGGPAVYPEASKVPR